MARGCDPMVREQWRERLRRFESSGLTVVEFCRREGVSQPSFYQWRKKFREGCQAAAEPKRSSNRSPCFVPVVPVPGRQTRAASETAPATKNVSIRCARDEPARRTEASPVVVVTLASGARVEVPAAEVSLVERVVQAAAELPSAMLPAGLPSGSEEGRP